MHAPAGPDRRGALAERRRRLWTAAAPLRRRVRARFEVDTRALAALRVALGLIVLVDLLHRAGDLTLFYTDAGLYPVSVYEVAYPRYAGLSLHALSGALWFQQALFAVAGLFAVLLVVGYRTRLVAAVSLALLFSLHARNPAVLNGADQLLRVLLLVAIPAPLGERWSVDALRRGRARGRVAGFHTAALLVQPVVVFGSNAVLKHQGTTWYAGEALQIAFANDVMTVHLGNHLAGQTPLLTALNYAWVALLAGSPVLLLGTTGRARAAAVFGYLGAFAGMLATMMVGLFPLVLSAALLSHLPAPFWDAAARRLPAGVTGRLRAATPDGPAGPQPVGRWLLDVLRARGDDDVAGALVGAGRSLCSTAGVLVLAWMLVYTGGYVTTMDVPDRVYDARLDQQRWGLYAPDPADSYAWLVVTADLTDGRTVDAFAGGEPTFDRPPDAAAEYATFRHRKFVETVRRSGGDGSPGAVATRYGEWACGRAIEVHGFDVQRVTVHEVEQPSPVDGTYEEPAVTTVVERDCEIVDDRPEPAVSRSAAGGPANPAAAGVPA